MELERTGKDALIADYFKRTGLLDNLYKGRKPKLLFGLTC